MQPESYVNPTQADVEASPARNRVGVLSEPATHGQESALSRVARCADPAGLVHSVTSVQPNESATWEEVNRHRRLARLRRCVLSAGSAFREACPRPLFDCLMVTLTYRPGVFWRRRHISDYLKTVRAEIPDGIKLRYIWVMELTKAGVPHYHVLLWLPAGVRLSMPDRSGAWPWGWSRVEKAHAPVGYLMKYASKGSAASVFPRGARIYGCGGLDAEQRLTVRWWMLPRYIRDQVSPQDRVVRAVGGGWRSTVNATWWPPWDGDVRSQFATPAL